MLPIYIPATDTIIRSYSERYVHQGETYGGTDYDDVAKLAMIGSVSLREEFPASGYVADGWEIVDDPVNEGCKLRRPTSVTRESPPTVEVLKERVNIERQTRLDNLTVTLTLGISGDCTFDADPVSRDNISAVISAISVGIPFGETITWRSSDNTNIVLSIEQLTQLAALILVNVQNIYNKSWELKDVTIPALSTEDRYTFDVTDNQYWLV